MTEIVKKNMVNIECSVRKERYAVMKEGIITFALVGIAVFTLGTVFFKNSHAVEPCMNHVDAQVFYTDNGDKAVRAPHEIHNGEPMVYLCK